MIIVAALYHFAPLNHYKEMRESLQVLCKEKGIKGTLILAREGINGTVAGSREAINQLIAYLKADECLKNLEHKESIHDDYPFFRLKIKIKKEIVTMGVENINPLESVGTYLSPKDWNNLLNDPEVVLVDTRNDYEVKIGTFKNAINPKTQTFREFPQYVQEQLTDKKDRKIAMFCTGGIRCEKSTAYLKSIGFKDVYHLKGGILKYLEEVKPEESLWQGECFVFDQRVAVNHSLVSGEFDQCYGCRTPISNTDKDSEHYIEGVQCHNCYNQYPAEHYQRMAERQHQIQLSKQNGQCHLGDYTAVRQKQAL